MTKVDNCDVVALENIPILGNLCDVYNLLSHDENYMYILYMRYIYENERERKREQMTK